MITVYAYANCSTCQKALKWLHGRKIAFREVAIREQPPTLAELRAMLAAVGDVRRLFNVSGLDYRALKLKDTLPGMSPAEALRLLAGNGNLVKRPFVIGGGTHLVGFRPVEWAVAFS